MIRIKCPFCGLRDHSEFTYGGDGSVIYPDLDASREAWHEAVYMRENVCGVQKETWHHVHGCRQWLIVERNTLTHQIVSVSLANQYSEKVLEAEKCPGVEFTKAFENCRKRNAAQSWIAS